MEKLSRWNWSQHGCENNWNRSAISTKQFVSRDGTEKNCFTPDIQFWNNFLCVNKVKNFSHRFFPLIEFENGIKKIRFLFSSSIVSPSRTVWGEVKLKRVSRGFKCRRRRSKKSNQNKTFRATPSASWLLHVCPRQTPKVNILGRNWRKKKHF